MKWQRLFDFISIVFLTSSIWLVIFQSAVDAAPVGITPIPMELLNPRLTEFRRIDSNNDDSLSFSEYLLSDRPWMETLSRRYHQLDLNSDGRVTRKEFETFFRNKEDEQEKQRTQADNFFKQLTVTVGPIVERDQVGNATNGASRMRFFSAGARKYAAIAHGTGLFHSPSSSVGGQSQTQSVPVDLPPAALLHDHSQHFRLFNNDDFPHHSHGHHLLNGPPPFSSHFMAPSPMQIGTRADAGTSAQTDLTVPMVDQQHQLTMGQNSGGTRPLKPGIADLNGPI